MQALPIGVQILENSKFHNFDHGRRNARKKQTKNKTKKTKPKKLEEYFLKMSVLTCFSTQFVKMQVLRFFHPPQVASSLAITSSCSEPPQRQSELLALSTYKGGGGRYALSAHGLATSSSCHISQ